MEEEEEEEGRRKAKPGPHLVSSTLANESAVDDGLLSPACPVCTSLLQPEPAQVRLQHHPRHVGRRPIHRNWSTPLTTTNRGHVRKPHQQTNSLVEPPQNASRMDVSYILTHGCCPRPLWAWLLSCNREVLQRQVSCGPPLLCLHFSILGMRQLKLSSPGAAMRERTNCLACEVNRLLLL